MSTWVTSQISKAQAAITYFLPPLRLAIFIGALLLLGFAVALIGSGAGEIAGALGSLIGGIIGAGGAVWAVFLLLSRQRQEESANVADAVRTEVTTLVKYVIRY
jgi:uncharacterized membrane protein YccC